jgi:hypothetical protein
MGSAGLSQVTTAQAQDDTSGDADLLPGAAPETPGARFRGRNVANQLLRWSRVCEVLTAEPAHGFSFRTIATTTKSPSRPSSSISIFSGSAFSISRNDPSRRTLTRLLKRRSKSPCESKRERVSPARRGTQKGVHNGRDRAFKAQSSRALS